VSQFCSVLPYRLGDRVRLVLLFVLLIPSPAPISAGTNLSPRLAVAWNDHSNHTGWVQGMDVNPPWNLSTERIEVGGDALLRCAHGKLYVLRPSADFGSVVDPGTWKITRSYPLTSGAEPEDIAVVGADTAYVSGRRATRLIRLNLASGATQNVADLSPFADPDGIPDLGGMALHAGRLLVQVRRLNMIDLDSLRSLGLVVHESDGFTGADTGPFVMVTPQRGYLVYTTDLTVSSHLNEFTLAAGPAPLAVFTAVGFLAPALVFEHTGNRMFFANSDTSQPGVRVFDAATAEQLSTNLIATGGPPSDLALLSDGPFSAEPASLSVGLHAGLRITGTTGATYRIEFVNQVDATNWMALTNITLPVSPYFWADPDAVTNKARRYYRAVAGSN
jgi:hypothetical protein